MSWKARRLPEFLDPDPENSSSLRGASKRPQKVTLVPLPGSVSAYLSVCISRTFRPERTLERWALPQLRLSWVGKTCLLRFPLRKRVCPGRPCWEGGGTWRMSVLPAWMRADLLSKVKSESGATAVRSELT